jgi:DNA primase
MYFCARFDCVCTKKTSVFRTCPIKIKDMIPQDTIDRVSEVPIADVVGSYFPLKKAGANLTANCPFHSERTPSFMVNPARNSYVCFGCGAKGGVIRFVMEYDKLTFPEAVRKIGEANGIEIQAQTKEESKESALRGRLKQAHGLLAAHYLKCLLHQTIGKRAQGYLRQRKFNSEICKRWGIGYAPPEGNVTVALLTHHKFTPKEIEATGLVYRGEKGMLLDKITDRIVFAIRESSGETIGFSARTIE